MSQPKNRIPTPSEKHVHVDRSTPQINEGLSVVKNLKRRQPPEEPKQSTRAPSHVEEKKPPKSQKIHPKYASPHKEELERERRERARAEQKQKQKLIEKQRRMEKLREKEELRRKKLKAEAEHDKRQREQQRHREQRQAQKRNAQMQKKYSRELSVEENNRRMLYREKQKEYRQALLKAYFFRFIASVILGIVLFIFSFSAFLIIFNLRSAPADELTVNICGNEKIYSDKMFISETTSYICMDDVAAACDLTLFKSNGQFKYISSDVGNESASFTPNSATVEINGTKIRLNALPFLHEEKLFVPLSFLTDYCLGLNVEYDRQNGTVNITRIQTGSVGDTPTYADITFKIKSSGELEHIDENILPN